MMVMVIINGGVEVDDDGDDGGDNADNRVDDVTEWGWF